MTRALRIAAQLVLLVTGAAAWGQPADAPSLPLSEVKAGQQGVVWTVFQGTRPEPFSVEVTGVIQNALGPGRSLILCRMTDPRVQNMGAVAGMSGSPLYIGGRFAGALSYQLQQFETVHYAGFTPAEDMAQVSDRVGADPARPTSGGGTALAPLQPVYSLSGVSPRTASLLAAQLGSLDIRVSPLSGSMQSGPEGDPLGEAAAGTRLEPGDAVSVALTTGDITLAAVGTVSRVDGRKITAFGHPMTGLGNVRMPMCRAEVVTILPSQQESFKVANVGPVIGCISQDRLSAVSGLVGPGPEMTDVEVIPGAQGDHAIHFQVIRDRRMAPMLVLIGVAQAVQQTNDAQACEGFRIRTTVVYPGSRELTRENVLAGPQGFESGLFEFLASLQAQLQNPFEDIMPDSVRIRVEPLEHNPSVTVEQMQLSRTLLRAGETLHVSVGWRGYQGATGSDSLDIPVSDAWSGKNLEVVAVPGRLLDELTGHGRSFSPGQLRSFDAYLDAMRDNRTPSGLYLAVVERSPLFFDQEVPAAAVPLSVQRIEAAADPSRFQKREALVVLWESHLLEGRVPVGIQHKAFHVEE